MLCNHHEERQPTALAKVSSNGLPRPEIIVVQVLVGLPCAKRSAQLSLRCLANLSTSASQGAKNDASKLSGMKMGECYRTPAHGTGLYNGPRNSVSVNMMFYALSHVRIGFCPIATCKRPGQVIMQHVLWTGLHFNVDNGNCISSHQNAQNSVTHFWLSTA